MQYNHFRLITLGRLTVSAPASDTEAESLAKQRRKLAVLAVLALSPRPVSRDTLTEMFWGERDERRARHSLSEALSHLRRLLGPDAIAQREAEVSLAPSAPLVVDARELAAAAQRRDDERVLTLYEGPFLHAVYVGASASFDAWAERERRRLERLFVDACARRTRMLAEAGEWDASARVAQRWLDTDPLAEAAMHVLLDALLAPGTGQSDVRALRAYAAIEQTLARGYEEEPPPSVRARIEEVRSRRAATHAASDPTASPPRSHGGAAFDPADLSGAEAAESGIPAVAAFPSADSDREGPVAPLRAAGSELRRWSMRLAAVAGAAVAISAGVLVFRPRADPLAPVASQAVAVLPFQVRGPAEYAYLREGVVDLLSANLEGAGPFRTVDPRAVLAAVPAERQTLPPAAASALAERLGAGLYVQGDVMIAGERIRLSASLYHRDWGSAPAAQGSVEGAPAELFRLVDRLTAQLLAGSARVTPAPMGRLAALTTHSLPALKHFLRGETEFRQGHYTEAFEAFRAATAEDSTFALAHFRLAHAANWAVPPGWTWDSIGARSRVALSHAERLSTRPKLLVQGYHAWLSGDYDTAERAYRAVVRSYPDEVEGWYQLGEVLFHTNPVRGRSILEAGEPFDRVLVLEPEHLGAMTHLVRVRAREGRPAALDSLLARSAALSPPDRQPEFRALRAFLLGTQRQQEHAVAELRASGNDEMIRATAHRVAVHGGRLDAAARLLTLLTDAPLADDVRAHAHLWLADLEVAHGRWRAARERTAAAAALDRATALERRALHEALPFGPASADELRAVRAALRAWDASATSPTAYPWLAPYNGLHAVFREHLLGAIALRLEDAEDTQRRADALDAYAGAEATRALAASLAESLRGHLAAADGRDRDALARLERGRLRVSEGLLETELGSQMLERWARAEVLRRQRRFDEAVAWYVSLPEISIAGLIFLAPVHLRLAEIADARGRHAEAVHHYARFVDLWKDADPELRERVRAAERRLAELRAGRISRAQHPPSRTRDR